VDMVLAALLSNAENAKKIIKNSLPKISKERKCSCKDALSTALITARDKMPDVTKKKLDIIIGKYI